MGLCCPQKVTSALSSLTLAADPEESPLGSQGRHTAQALSWAMQAAFPYISSYVNIHALLRMPRLATDTPGAKDYISSVTI